jgi:hypothetical protein
MFHCCVPLHRPANTALRLCSGLCQQALAQEDSKDHGQEHDHYRATDELGQCELPTHEQRQDDAQLDDEVGRSNLEGHRRDEARTFDE